MNKHFRQLLIKTERSIHWSVPSHTIKTTQSAQSIYLRVLPFYFQLVVRQKVWVLVNVFNGAFYNRQYSTCILESHFRTRGVKTANCKGFVSSYGATILKSKRKKEQKSTQS